MKKTFCLFACLCSFALSAMGDGKNPFLIIIQGLRYSSQSGECVIPSPRPMSPENDDVEVTRYSGKVPFDFDRCCWVKSPQRTDKDDEKDCLGRCPISPVEQEKQIIS